MNWIFVTGMIRSGTTLVGKVLSLPWSVGYLHEPFNGGHSTRTGSRFEARYISHQTENAVRAAYRDHVADIFSLDLKLNITHHPNYSLPRRIVKKVAGSRGPVNLAITKLNPLVQFIVLKDPVGKLTTNFLWEEFGAHPVVLVRHPVSLAASLDRVGWYPEMLDFTSQPDLVDDFFAEEQEFLNREWPSRLMEAMAHWRATYKVLLSQAEESDDWVVVTHEDISAEPVEVFSGMYEQFGLPWSERIQKRVEQLTGSRSSPEARGDQAMDLRRDSSKLFETRRDSVPVETRREIFDIVKDVALKLYTRESFAID